MDIRMNRESHDYNLFIGSMSNRLLLKEKCFFNQNFVD